MTSQHSVLKTPLSAYVSHPLHCRDIAYTLSQQTTVFMMPHPLQAWHHTPWIRHCTHCILVITTSPLISHPLLNAITPSFCVTSYALYRTSHPILMSHSTVLMTSQPLYMKPHPVCRATYTLYMRHQSHYLCPHTQSIDNITPTLCTTSHSPYVWHRLPYTRHHILTLWRQTTVFMSSHPLYLTSCPLCVDVSSHQLYWWYHTNCISEITSAIIHDIISSVYDMAATGSVS